MPRDAEQSSNEKAFILQALQQDLRVDGRALEAFRKIDINFGEDYGSVEVRIGKTKVLVRISCEVTAPYPERKFDGIFTITSEFSPMASPAFEIGRPTQDEVILSRLLEKTIRRSGALDTEALCIVAGSKCFHLRADLHILDHDGNITDCACLALLIALRHFRRPDVAVEGEKVTVFTTREREPVPLSLLHHPLCITVSYFDRGNIAIVDATKAEENVREGEVIFSMNGNGELCQIAKYGGSAVMAAELLDWTRLASIKVKELSKLIEGALKADAERRDKGGLAKELMAESDRGVPQLIG